MTKITMHISEYDSLIIGYGNQFIVGIQQYMHLFNKKLG